MSGKIAARLAELGIELPPLGRAAGVYRLSVRAGDHVYLAGHGPLADGRPTITGVVPTTVSVEQAKEAARFTALSLLATLSAELDGDLDRVMAIPSLTGYVRAEPDFTEHPSILNAASELLGEVFGDRGRHARAAVGVASLPFGIPVEISLVAIVAG